jgi:type I restriction enzyme S subunit
MQPSLRMEDLDSYSFFAPQLSEQRLIADFLDKKCAEIEALSADIQAEIDTLEQYKKSVVFDIVMHGVNKSIEMVSTDSDVWTEIPKEWQLKDIKYIFEIVKRIAGKEGYDVLSVTQKGLKVKDIKSGDGQLADNYSGYQFVYPTDYVMNHMDLLTGWVDLSSMFGVTSPDYRVFRLQDKENNSLEYYKYVMQCCYMNKIFYSLGQGVSNLGRWRLQTSSFNNFKIPVPPKAVQIEIANYLNKIIGEVDSIIDSKQEQLNILDDYKKSLIYEYVTGKKEVSEQ